MICSLHPDELLTFYCCDCCQGLCRVCEASSHVTDHVNPIDNLNLVKNRRDKLRSSFGNLPKEGHWLNDYKVQVRKTIEAVDKSFNASIQELMSLRGNIVKHIDREMQGLVDELKKLDTFAGEIADVQAKPESLASYISGVLMEEKSSAPEIVLAGDQLPNISDPAVPIAPHYRLPSLDRELKQLKLNSQSLVSYHEGPREALITPSGDAKSPSVDKQLSHLNHQGKSDHVHKMEGGEGTNFSSIEVLKFTGARVSILWERSNKHQIAGAVYDNKGPGWWIKTEQCSRIDRNVLLKIDLEGKTCSKHILKEPVVDCRFCLDTKRNEIVVSKSVAIERLSREFDPVKRFDISEGGHLCDITHCPKRDIYVVSDIATQYLYFISCESGKILREVDDVMGDSDDEHFDPQFVCHQRIGANECNVVVSDCENHCVQLYSCAGDFIRKYGTRGSGVGQLNKPRGVCVDPWGRIIVCDSGNRRVVCFWWDGAEQCEVLLNRTQLKGAEPNCVSVSDDGEYMLVTTMIYKPSKLICCRLKYNNGEEQYP